MMSRLVISELAVYPVKSFAQVSLKVSDIQFGGLRGDRRWMVIDHDGGFLTQRQLARMSLVRVVPLGNGISLSAQGMSEMEVSIPEKTSSTLPVRVWKDTCQAVDCGGEIAAWLHQYLGVEARMVYFPDEEIRVVDQAYAKPGDRTAFSDGFPILLTTEASLQDLNSRLETPIPMLRFRPNIVISGSEAYAEDEWKRLKAGDILLRVVKPCSRCVIPTINTQTGEKGIEPSRTLAKYRKRGNNIYFGQNVIADGEGVLELGMPVEVLE